MEKMAESTVGGRGAADLEGRRCELRNPHSRSKRRMLRCRDWGLRRRTRRLLRICMCPRSTRNLGPAVAVLASAHEAVDAVKAEQMEELVETEGAATALPAGVAVGSDPACTYPEWHS